MNQKFVFSRQASKDLYKKVKGIVVQSSYREKSKFVILILWFIINITVYGIYVNLASTKGYFLSQAEYRKEQLAFNYNITTLNIASYRNKLREGLQRGRRVEKIEIRAIEDK